MAQDESIEQAAEAYIYGFPLVFCLEQIDRVVKTGFGGLPPTPFNTFGHGRTLANSSDTFVSINNDTLYSIAPIDLSVGPVHLTVPEAGDRYYVLQFVDAWTDNFAYVGTRGTGSGAGSFLLVPPGWEGEPSIDGATVIRFPTRIAIIVGRWACAGEADLPAVHALQDALQLTQVLETFAGPEGLPAFEKQESDALTFFEEYRVWSQAFPPAERDVDLQASFEPLGLTSSQSLAKAPDEVKEALTAGFAAGREALEASLHGGSSAVVNGWNLTFHVFDYNLDYFEVGAIDSDEWKIDNAKTRLAERAGAALAGLWGNHGYEAAYIMSYVDAAGDALSGAHDYTLRLSPTPPVDAFWSVTMYDIPEFFLVDNEIGRYSIGDRTPGIVPDPDGGLTITFSRTAPSDPVARANWLPTPEGAFRPILRMYSPRAEVFDGSYTVPAIERRD